MTFIHKRILEIIMLLRIFVFTSLVKHVLSFQPEFAEPIVNISVAIGRDATFTCHVRHLGGYRVGWVKADTKAIQAIHEHVITHNPRVSVSHSDLLTWNLHIKYITEEDRGGYMCQLNTDPMKSQIGYLDVVVPPDFITQDSSSDVLIPESSSVKLICRARGHPHPNVTWKREDNAFIQIKDENGIHKSNVSSLGGEILKLNKVSRSEMGTYLCIASNGVPPSVSKRISLTIQFHPVVSVSNQLVGSPFDKDVRLDCAVEASPKSINYWVRDAGEMIVSSYKYNVQEKNKSLFQTEMSVTIRRFQKEDIGLYQCIAKNSLGEVSGQIRLYEIPDPKGNSITYKQGGMSNDVLAKHPKQLDNSKDNYQPEDDDQIGSAEDYDDSSLIEQTHIKTTKTNSFEHNYRKIGYNFPVTRKPFSKSDIIRGNSVIGGGGGGIGGNSGNSGNNIPSSGSGGGNGGGNTGSGIGNNGGSIDTNEVSTALSSTNVNFNCYFLVNLLLTLVITIILLT